MINFIDYDYGEDSLNLRSALILLFCYQGHSNTLQSADDQANWKTVQHSLDILDFSVQQQKALFAIVASVLHLGNVKFEGDDVDAACVSNIEVVDNISEVITIKFLNFWTPENFAVNYLEFKQRGQTFGYFVNKMQME